MRPWDAFDGAGCGIFSGQVAVEDFAEVVALGGVGAQAAPHFLLQRQPEVFGDVLLGAPQKDGGRVGAVQVDRLIGGEQQNPGTRRVRVPVSGR